VEVPFLDMSFFGNFVAYILNKYLIQWKGYSYKQLGKCYGCTLSEASCRVLTSTPPILGPHAKHFNYISFQSSLDHHAELSLPRGG